MVIQSLTELRAYENSILELFADELNETAIKVFKAIAKYTLSATGQAFPSVKKIAEVVGIHERTVQRYTSVLEKLGIIEKKARFREKKGGYSSNIYTLLMPKRRIKKNNVVSPAVSVDGETPTESKGEGLKKNRNLNFNLLKNTVMSIDNNEKEFSYESSKYIKDFATRTALWIIAKQEKLEHVAVQSIKDLSPYIKGFFPVKKSIGAIYRTILRQNQAQLERVVTVENNKDDEFFYNWLED